MLPMDTTLHCAYPKVGSLSESGNVKRSERKSATWKEAVMRYIKELRETFYYIFLYSLTRS